jgi:hypothetical protein
MKLKIKTIARGLCPVTLLVALYASNFVVAKAASDIKSNHLFSVAIVNGDIPAKEMIASEGAKSGAVNKTFVTKKSDDEKLIVKKLLPPATKKTGSSSPSKNGKVAVKRAECLCTGGMEDTYARCVITCVKSYADPRTVAECVNACAGNDALGCAQCVAVGGIILTACMLGCSGGDSGYGMLLDVSGNY